MRLFNSTISLSAILLLIASAGLPQQAPSPPPSPDNDPFVGTWKANADLSLPKLRGADASYTRIITREGDERVVSSRYGLHKSRKHSFRMRCDGQFYRVPDGTHSMACQYLNSDVVDGETVTHSVHSYWTEQVSASKQQMTITSYTDKTRTTIESTWILDRVN